MRPSAQSIILGDQWSSRARDRFRTLVNGNSFIVSLYSILHNVMRVELLINTEMTNTSVADILVEDGHALKVEESFDSKVTKKLGLLTVRPDKMCLGETLLIFWGGKLHRFRKTCMNAVFLKMSVCVCSWQQNNGVLMSLYKDMETGMYVPDATSSCWKDRKKEEKELIDDLLAHFSRNSQSISKTKARYTAAYRTVKFNICTKNVVI